jgi:hypothetical protein
MSNEYENIIAKRKPFNGRPFSHWEERADWLVVETIMRIGLGQDERSLIGYLVGKRLLEIARAENPKTFEKLLKTCITWQAGFARFMRSILP